MWSISCMRTLAKSPLAFTSIISPFSFKPFTTTSDGEKHKYSKIQDIKLYKGFGMYSDSRHKMITMPEVNVGSILEYKVTIHTNGKPMKEAFWYGDYLESSITLSRQGARLFQPSNHQ